MQSASIEKPAYLKIAEYREKGGYEAAKKIKSGSKYYDTTAVTSEYLWNKISGRGQRDDDVQHVKSASVKPPWLTTSEHVRRKVKGLE